MAITHSTAARNAGANAMINLIDGGTGAGKLKLKAAGGAVLATLICSDPAFGAAATGQKTSNAITSDTNAAGGGDAALFDFTDSNDVVVVSGTVSATGGPGDLTIDNATIGAGDTVAAGTITYTAPA